jgi:hypothetical protein
MKISINSVSINASCPRKFGYALRELSTSLSMANPELRDAVQHVTNELQGLRSVLSFDNISRAIKTFDGSQANLRNWLNEVEKFPYINRIDDNATKLIAYQSAGGKCSEFLQRVFQEYPSPSHTRTKSACVRLLSLNTLI